MRKQKKITSCAQEKPFCGSCNRADSCRISVITWQCAGTMVANKAFECMALTHGMAIQWYYGDIIGAAFTSQEFVKHVLESDQVITFSGTDTHHQNGVAECAIWAVVLHTWTMLMHASLCWPEATDTPHVETGFTPLQLLSKLSARQPMSGGAYSLCFRFKTATWQGNPLNSTTKSNSPQYHLIYDDYFSTIHNKVIHWNKHGRNY